MRMKLATWIMIAAVAGLVAGYLANAWAPDAAAAPPRPRGGFDHPVR